MDVLPARLSLCLSLRLPLLLGGLVGLSLRLPLLLGRLLGLSLRLPLLLGGLLGLSLRLPLLLGCGGGRLLSPGLRLPLLLGCGGGDSRGDPSAVRRDCPAGGRLCEGVTRRTLDAADYLDTFHLMPHARVIGSAAEPAVHQYIDDAPVDLPRPRPAFLIHHVDGRAAFHGEHKVAPVQHLLRPLCELSLLRAVYVRVSLRVVAAHAHPRH